MSLAKGDHVNVYYRFDSISVDYCICFFFFLILFFFFFLNLVFFNEYLL